MSYDFKVSESEKVMKNYFKNARGAHIKDTLIITLRNTGTKGWQKYNGWIKCVEEESNLIFDSIQISEDTYPGGFHEVVLTFPRIDKNNSHGKCYSTIQLEYKNVSYTKAKIHFIKNYDLWGNEIVEGKEEQNVEEEEEEKPKVEKEEDEKNIIEEEEEIKEIEPQQPKIKPILEGKDDLASMLKKFRACYQFSKEDYSDDYIKSLLEKGNNDFGVAMVIHVESEEQKKEDNKKKSKDEKGLEELMEQFREEYQLSKDDYSDEVVKKALQKAEGVFGNAFEELMSFIA